MSKTNGRTGERARANIQPPPTPGELDAAKREVPRIKGRLADLSAAHPSVKIWNVRLRAAEAMIARAPKVE